MECGMRRKRLFPLPLLLHGGKTGGQLQGSFFLVWGIVAGTLFAFTITGNSKTTGEAKSVAGKTTGN